MKDATQYSQKFIYQIDIFVNIVYDYARRSLKSRVIVH
jgi:hypothetical protein